MADFDPFDLTNLAEGHKRYLITNDEGEFTVDVPETWKVTYGRLHAGNQGWDGGRRTGNYLRFYEAENKQRAIFANVKNFRDLSIKIHKFPTETELQAQADDLLARANRPRRVEVRTVNDIFRTQGVVFADERQAQWADQAEPDAEGPEEADPANDVVDRVNDMPF